MGPPAFFDRIANRRLHLQIGRIDTDPVAFKLGYALDDATFYSWLGGVHPTYRGLGIAHELMTTQHDWCVRRASRRSPPIENRWRTQVILNMKHGFDIVGTDAKSGKILFENGALIACVD